MRKIGELKGKPIIEGNPNEIKKNQIHYKESDGGITLSERREDNTLSSVTSGSGSGEGVKEYYYKIKETYEDSFNMFYKMLLYCIASKIDIIIPINGDVKVFYEEVSIASLLLFPDDGHLHVFTTDFFKISDIIQPVVMEVSVSENVRVNSNFYTKGDLFTKLDYISNLVEDTPELLAMVNIVKDNAIAVTKEEYESMITYKPE